MIHKRAVAFSVTTLAIAVIATSVWLARRDIEVGNSLGIDPTVQVDRATETNRAAEATSAEPNSLPGVGQSAAGPIDKALFSGSNEASNRLVAERIVSGPEYVEASLRLTEMFSASKTLVVMRSDIVRVDLDVVERLLAASRHQPDGFQNSFELSLFGEESCAVSRTRAISEYTDSGTTRFELSCEDSVTDVFLYEGNRNLLLRLVGPAGRPDVRLGPIGDAGLFAVYEVMPVPRGPSNF